MKIQRWCSCAEEGVQLYGHTAKAFQQSRCAAAGFPDRANFNGKIDITHRELRFSLKKVNLSRIQVTLTPGISGARYERPAACRCSHFGFSHHEGLEDETLDAILELRDVEVDQQSCLDAGKLHVCQQLRLVDALDLLDTLQLKDQPVLH